MAAWVAWHAGVLSQVSKIPPLSDLLPAEDRPKSRRQTPEEQLAIALAWNAKLGGQVIPNKGV